jgi:arylsulfatase A-like enzyme
MKRVDRDVQIILLLGDLGQQRECHEAVWVSFEGALGGDPGRLEIASVQFAFCLLEVASHKSRSGFLCNQYRQQEYGGQEPPARQARGRCEESIHFKQSTRSTFVSEDATIVFMRWFPTVFCTVVFTLSTEAQESISGSRPNVIFIFSDDHAAHAISAYGSLVNKTPNIDRIASEGLLFRNNFCGNALCGPSRATILTGLHSHQNGFMRNGNVFDGGQTTFPKLLQRVGYQTAIIGKWHLSSDPQGFDHWVVLPGQGQYYNPDFKTKDGRVRLEGHATNLTTKLSIDWLDQRDPDKPFLLMCQHKAPHRNWQPAPEDLALFLGEQIPEPATLFDDYSGRGPMAKSQEMSIANHMFLHYDLIVPPKDPSKLKGTDSVWRSQRKRMTEAQLSRWDEAFDAENVAFLREDPQGEERVRWAYQRYMKNYLRCVNGVDRSVGELLAWLDARPKVKANTIIIYSSDQGFYLGDHGWYDKRWMYDESLRMPLVVRWPDHLKPGVEVPNLTQNIDFAPTFLDLAGVPVPKSMHGESLVPLLEAKGGADAEEVEWRDAIYYHYYESQAVHMVPAMYGVRTDRYKLIRYYEPQWDSWEMFDLDEDPDEMHNVVEDPKYAEIRAGLARRLTQLREQYGDDTGTVGGGEYPVTAGVARVAREGEDLRVWMNAPGGYLLKTGNKPGNATLSTSMLPIAGKQRQNGYLLIGGGAPRGQMMRAGIEFGNKRLVIMGPQWRKVAAQTPIEWDGKSAVDVAMHVDFDKHEVVVEAQGKRIVAPMPTFWNAIRSWGYGANNAETVFGPLVVQ